MLKKLNLSSPLGIALTAAGIFLALSPGARRTVRNMMVKGTAGVMDAMEHAGTVTSGLRNTRSITWTSSDGDQSEHRHPLSEQRNTIDDVTAVVSSNQSTEVTPFIDKEI